MKKSLLSLAAAMLTIGAASAESIVYNMNDVTEDQISGTYKETTYKEDGTTVQAYANWQPLTSVELGVYSLTFGQDSSTKPAFYTAKEGSQWTIRVYKGGTMTIKAPVAEPLTTVTLYTDTSTALNGSADKGTGTWDATDKCYTWSAPADATTEEVTFTFTGTFRLAKIQFGGEGPAPIEYKAVSTIAELCEEVGNGDYYNFTGKAIVSYANGANCYVYDETGATLLYSSKTDPWAEVLPAGTVITAMNGVRSDYGTTVEYIPEMNTLKTDGIVDVAVNVCTSPADVEALGINEYLSLADVDFTQDTENAKYGTATFADGSEVTIYNAFTSSSFNPVVTYPANGKYTIYGLRSAYNGAVQVNAVKFDTVTSVVTNFEEVAEGEAEYYNLQGVRVANPENGLYIKVLNGKSTKVVL